MDMELLNRSTAVCQVMGDSDDYEVQIQANSGKDGLTFSCDCPYAGDGNFCKHMIAAALELTDFLDDDVVEDDDFDDEYVKSAVYRQPPSPPARRAARNWQTKLSVALASGAYRSRASRSVRYVGLVLLERPDYYGYGTPAVSGPTYSLTPYVIPAHDWPALSGDETGQDPQTINGLLETDRKWIRVGRPLSQTADPAACLKSRSSGGRVLECPGQLEKDVLRLWNRRLADAAVSAVEARTATVQRQHA